MERMEQTAESSPFFSEIGGTRDASSSTSAAWSEQQSRAVRVVITVLASATADEADSPAIFFLFLPSLAPSLTWRSNQRAADYLYGAIGAAIAFAAAAAAAFARWGTKSPRSLASGTIVARPLEGMRAREWRIP